MSVRQQGAALVIVLWLIALLTASIGTFVMSARVEALQANVLATNSQAEQLARAGIEYAIARVQQTNVNASRWIPDGRRYRWQYAGKTIELRLTDESAKVDLTVADAGMLAALMRAVGVDSTRAQHIAGAIVDWRDQDDLVSLGGGAEKPDYLAAGRPYGPKNQAFENISELRLVLGMDSDLYRKLAPLVTVYSGSTLPNPKYAAEPILTAMGIDVKTVIAQRQQTELASGEPGSNTFSIDSRVDWLPGRQTTLHAIIRAIPSQLPKSTYTILSWDHTNGTAEQ